MIRHGVSLARSTSFALQVLGAWIVLFACESYGLHAADEVANVRSQQKVEVAPAGLQPKRQPSTYAPVIRPDTPLEEDRTLVLPRSWQPTGNDPTPPVSPPLAKITIPDLLAGCWQGRPEDYDKVYCFHCNFPAGRPGLVTVCFHGREIEMNAEVTVPALVRALEVALNMGIGYTQFHARGIQSDVYVVAPTVMRGRTALEIDRTFRLAYLIPIPASAEPTTVDWKAYSTENRDILRVEAYQVVWWSSGSPSFGATWHADFKRVAQRADESSR